MVFLAITQVHAGFQFGAEAVAEVADDALGLGVGEVLEAVALGVVDADKVVGIAHHTAGAEGLFFPAETAAFDFDACARCRAAGVGDKVDGAAQRQSAVFKSVGPAQHFGVVQALGVEQLIRRTARAGQRQAVKEELGAFTEIPW